MIKLRSGQVKKWKWKENEETAKNGRRGIKLLEMSNEEVELLKDRKIGIEDRERQHVTKTGTIPKATIRSIDII